MSATIHYLPIHAVGVPPIPAGATRVTDDRRPVADFIHLKRAAELVKAEAGHITDGAVALAVAHLADALAAMADRRMAQAFRAVMLAVSCLRGRQ